MDVRLNKINFSRQKAAKSNTTFNLNKIDKDLRVIKKPE